MEGESGSSSDGKIKIPINASSGNLLQLANFDKWWILFGFVICLILFLIITQPDPYLRILKFVQDGIGITIFTTAISFVMILVVGLLAALMRMARNKYVSGIATVYVEIVRGIPLLVQLIFWYYAFPSIVQGIGNNLNINFLKGYLANPIAMAVFGLTICYAAYMSEIYRAGIQSIGKGQMEAARSLGMSYFQSMRYVILPQAVRVILPPVGNEFIALLKDSSLISSVAVADMTRRGREFMAMTYIPVQTWIMIALLYLVLTLFSARVVFWLEKKTKLER